MEIPSLASFRFFEAAAQTGSFVKAAESLHVTHGAVSRQIRLLEEALGVELFERRNRAIFLNAAGRSLHTVTQSVFEQLEGAVYRLQQSAQDNVLTLSCEPTIAMKWLIPRLPAFNQAHPDIKLHLVAAGGPIDFVRSGVDLALRRDDFHWDPQTHAVKVCDEWMGPVSRDKTERKNSLEGMRLLYTGTRPKAWATWQRQTHVSLKGSTRADYEHFYLCIQAAVSGLGIAMASFLMVQDEIANGQLHAPYGFAQDGSAYYLLSPIPLEQNEKYVRFHTWLMQEVSTGLSGVENAC
ncbi:LysR family transcriptional regulator [Pectobacterium carotovorum]|uniref:LysR substrate-binding domain-containing protein n=1 Tax=Pectobacterium carotovorum TaxID=554 RepID=UPI001F0F1669|nr:LysR substrate-binding domain-containing protein [Pectobacterium carotovorum]MCH4996269.1 LysR family transcriptional regulator [Pectobacterium carotovorum]